MNSSMLSKNPLVYLFAVKTIMTLARLRFNSFSQIVMGNVFVLNIVNVESFLPMYTILALFQ